MSRNLLVLVALGGMATVAFAFTEPSVGPTGGTVYAPVNTSGTAQTKAGDFYSSGTVRGNIINALSSLCLNGSCISSWGGAGDLGLQRRVSSTLCSGVNLSIKTINADGSVVCETDDGGGSQWTTSGSSIYYNSGNVGIGTTGSLYKLSVSINNATAPTSGGGDGLVLQNTNTTANSLTNILFQATDSGGTTRHSGAIVMGKESNWSGTDYPGYLSFWTRPAASSEIERLRITSTGNVGIGTTVPNQGKVEVMGGTVCVDTNSDGNASSCIASESDARLKENIAALDPAVSLEKILQLNPVSFDWRVNDAEVIAHYPLITRFALAPHSVGLIAQEVAPIFPEAVPQETVGDGETQYLQLDYQKFIPHIIGAVKQLRAKITAVLDALNGHEKRIGELEAEVAALRARIDAFEKK